MISQTVLLSYVRCKTKNILKNFLVVDIFVELCSFTSIKLYHLILRNLAKGLILVIRFLCC